MAQNPSPLIELVGIGKCYGSDTQEESTQPKVQVLNEVSLSINAGEFVAIIGASGSGKSTLMNILGCLDKPTSGQYLFAGKDVAGLDTDQLAWLRRKAFGFIFQSYHLILSESAVENVQVPALYAGLPERARHERAQLLLTRLGLEERLDYRPSQLSGGQQQRVSIARALMNGGCIILADEPTGALDTTTSAEVMQLLSELASAGHTIILITHDQQVAQQARRVIEISDGKIISDHLSSVLNNDLVKSDSEEGHSALPPPDLNDAAHDKGATFLAGLKDAAQAAQRVMLSNLFRTGLTLLGIIIGVSSVIIMLSIANGAKQVMNDKFGETSADLIGLEGASPTQSAPKGSITLHDVNVLSRLPEIKVIEPNRGRNKLLRYGNVNHYAYVRGGSVNVLAVKHMTITEGRLFNEQEYNRAAAVVVIGKTVRKTLFKPEDNPLGELIVVGKTPFTVVGVLGDRGKGENWDRNNELYVPYNTATTRLFGPGDPGWVSITIAEGYSLEHIEKVITDTMLRLHKGVKDFEVNNHAAESQLANDVMGNLSILVGAIAGISLLVGGIGVMNVMLMTVRERTREIGIRMATGARQRDILRQFLTESVLLSVVGGLIGIALAMLVLLILVLVSDKVPVAISAGVIATAFGFAVITGVVFGFTPARKAAQLNPVTALASE